MSLQLTWRGHPALVGIDHAFSFRIAYYDRHRLPRDLVDSPLRSTIYSDKHSGTAAAQSTNVIYVGNPKHLLRAKLKAELPSYDNLTVS